MANEEMPEDFDDFCEFIIQQSAKKANEFFEMNPKFAREFLSHFSPTNGRVFYRGGYPNLDRVFLCASVDSEVAMNFAKYGNNYAKDTVGIGNFMEVTSELYYKTKCNVDNENEVFLWKPKVLRTKRLKDFPNNDNKNF